MFKQMTIFFCDHCKKELAVKTSSTERKHPILIASIAGWTYDEGCAKDFCSTKCQRDYHGVKASTVRLSWKSTRD